jgi:hypothetical protein
MTPADPDGEHVPSDEERRVGAIIYAFIKEIRGIDGAGIHFNHQKFQNVVYGLRYVVPQMIREDETATPERKRAMRQLTIASDRGQDFLGTADDLLKMFALMNASGGAFADLLNYIEFDFDADPIIRDEVRWAASQEPVDPAKIASSVRKLGDLTSGLR